MFASSPVSLAPATLAIASTACAPVTLAVTLAVVAPLIWRSTLAVASSSAVLIATEGPIAACAPFVSPSARVVLLAEWLASTANAPPSTIAEPAATAASVEPSPNEPATTAVTATSPSEPDSATVVCWCELSASTVRPPPDTAPSTVARVAWSGVDNATLAPTPTPPAASASAFASASSCESPSAVTDTVPVPLTLPNASTRAACSDVGVFNANEPATPTLVAPAPEVAVAS